jgi:hypothetical protein
MPSVAEELRKETLLEVLQLSPGARVSLALELGDFDLKLFCSNQNLQRSEALERLRRTRQIGRRTRVPDGSRR